MLDNCVAALFDDPVEINFLRATIHANVAWYWLLKSVRIAVHEVALKCDDRRYK